jgi:hypothetical protein
MELLAEQVQRDHLARAAHAALLAQLPRSTAGSSANHAVAVPRLAVARSAVAIANPIRLRTANALRALATRLDPCEPGLVRIVNSR